MTHDHPPGTPAVPEGAPLDDAVRRLEALLLETPDAVIAVSGGVDSLTLAAFAVEWQGDGITLAHAVSPAVPMEATRRVKAFAAERRAHLVVLDAGEFSDEAYRTNPLNRCYFCKSHLYEALSARFKTVVFSGANLDDLGDYRPGLQAAAERGVRHPLIEAGLKKDRVRQLARRLGLGDIAELPASPCLSSRVETGLRIEPSALALIDAVESELRSTLSPRTVRCRVRHRGLVVEMDAGALDRLGSEGRSVWGERIAAQAKALGFTGPVNFEPYRQGSAFLRPSP